MKNSLLLFILALTLVPFTTHAAVISANGFKCTELSDDAVKCDGRFERAKTMLIMGATGIQFVLIRAILIDKTTSKPALFLYSSNNGCLVIRKCADNRCKSVSGIDVINKDGKLTSMDEKTFLQGNIKPCD